MPRPAVRIDAPNLLDHLRRHLDAILPRFKALPGVVGITLNGGMSRGYADALSEIDVTLFLDPAAYAAWQGGRAPLETGITRIDGMLYDLKYVDLAAETAREWGQVDLWDLSYAEILHDPTGALADLFAQKLASRPDPAEASGPLFSAWWHYDLAGTIWLRRGDTLQGHMMLNHAVENVITALFLVNREYVPHEKWLIHMSRSLDWTPAHWETRLADAMRVDATLDSLRARQVVIAGLWDEIDRCAVERCAPGLPVRLMQKSFYDWLARLAEQGQMPLAEWESFAPLSMLTMAPFGHVVTVEDDTIRLDRAKLLALSPDEVYRWHFEIVQAVRQAEGA